MTSRYFTQAAPELGNQLDDDPALCELLARLLPGDVARVAWPELRDLGALAGGELFRLQQEDRASEPTLTQWSPWGERIDRIDVSPLWQRAEREAAERGVVATAYEGRHGAWDRVVQFALAYLFTPSTDIYSCPLAMTDGAAAALRASGNRALRERALPHLTSRDPATFWTSGQWMTESTGGSDVSGTETVARHDGGDRWRLTGRKWFTSATTSQMALTLARPEGNGPGGHGLALFYVEPRDEAGRLQGIRVARLKDKLGTRKVPTAELYLDDAPARLVGDRTGGVRAIAPMLNVTRTWNAVSAVALMRRGLALAGDYARKRAAFGAPLAEKPLHVDTLAGLQAELDAGLQLTFRVVALLGRVEAGEASEAEAAELRLLTPLAKLVTGKQAVAVTSEVLESFGGAGYVEDTGLPTLLRDAQVLPIWEGTTNVLSLDALRALARDGAALEALTADVRAAAGAARDPGLAAPARTAVEAVAAAGRWLAAHRDRPPALEAGARRFALTLGRGAALALLVRHAQWALDAGRGARAAAAARRFALSGIDVVSAAPDPDDARRLVRGSGAGGDSGPGGAEPDHPV